MKIEKFTIFVPGTCGELIQGKIENKNFLVTAPINLFSRVTITKKGGSFEAHDLGWKTEKAIKLFSQKFSIKLEGFSLTLSSDIPKAKGMASSSADISSVIYALGRYYNLSITPEEVAKIAIEIEPTDGVMFPGIVVFDYISGSFWEYIGKPLPLRILIVDFGGEVDTLKFNKQRIERDEEFSRYLLDSLKKAFKERDIYLFGRIITESTLENEKFLPKRGCKELIEKAISLGAVGVNTAHSGTVCGIYTPYSKKEEVDKLRKIFPNFSFLGWHDFVGGGYLFEM